MLCQLCESEDAHNFHHFIPRTLHSNKWFKKRYTREQMRERHSDQRRQLLSPAGHARRFRQRRSPIAVKKSEHRPVMAEHFPRWVDQIEYWHIDDLDCAEPEEALPILEEHVRALVARLADGR